LAITSTQTLLSALFQLPTRSSTDNGPTVTLPAPITLLPREKPLPKPKPPTKWERFAKERGISHSKKERDVWDDDKQEWVSRWGKGGKNREKEEVWLSEVKAGSGECDLCFRTQSGLPS
jgi:regulator of ribosome biosynthesis